MWFVEPYQNLAIKARQSFYALRIFSSHGLLGDCLFDVLGPILHTWQDALLLICLLGLHGRSEARGSGGDHPEVGTLGYKISLPVSIPHRLKFFATHLTTISLPPVVNCFVFIVCLFVQFKLTTYASAVRFTCALHGRIYLLST